MGAFLRVRARGSLTTWGSHEEGVHLLVRRCGSPCPGFIEPCGDGTWGESGLPHLRAMKRRARRAGALDLSNRYCAGEAGCGNAAMCRSIAGTALLVLPHLVVAAVHACPRSVADHGL